MLNSIQTLRAVAAYAVVIYHCLIRSIQPADPLGKGYLDLLSGGVDLFFIISGFVMVHTTRDTHTPAQFAIKRLARIVPLYWLATFIVIGFVLVRPWTFYSASLSPEAILASLFFIPHPDGSGQTYPILGVGWTLNFEMLFYALFALSMFLPRRFRLIGIVTLILLVWTAAILAGPGVISTFYARPLMVEFAAGCILAYALRNERFAAFARSAPYWPVTLAAIAWLAIVPLLIPVDVPSVLRVGPSALLLVFAAVARDMFHGAPRETLFTRLGDASYSAYLLHPIVIVVVAPALGMAMAAGPAMEIVLAIAVIVSTALVSLLSLRYVERPSTALVRKLLSGARTDSAARL